MKEVYTELALTIPLRHTHIIAFLPQLVQPLLHALESSSELAVVGLRLMDSMVEQFNAEFLDAMMEPVRSDVLLALWRHVKPLPYAHGALALKVLGKLGGRNRDFSAFPEKLDAQDMGETDKLTVALEGKKKNFFFFFFKKKNNNNCITFSL